MGGGLIKAEWFKRHRQNELPEQFDRIVQSWDTANKATELSDYSVCTTWGLKGKHLFADGVLAPGGHHGSLDYRVNCPMVGGNRRRAMASAV